MFFSKSALITLFLSWLIIQPQISWSQQASDQDSFSVVVDEFASLKNYQLPERPKRELPEGMEGKVLIKVLVSDSGTVAGYQMLRDFPLSYGFGAAVVKAIKDWTFEPAKYQGQKVKSWVLVDVDFTKSSIEVELKFRRTELP